MAKARRPGHADAKLNREVCSAGPARFWPSVASMPRSVRSPRERGSEWERSNIGARSQRLLWASTGTKNPKASDVLYVKSLAAPHTVNTIPEKTLFALSDHGEIGAMLLQDGADAELVLDALAADLLREGAAAFVKSWDDLLACIVEKSDARKKAPSRTNA